MQLLPCHLLVVNLFCSPCELILAGEPGITPVITWNGRTVFWQQVLCMQAN